MREIAASIKRLYAAEKIGHETVERLTSNGRITAEEYCDITGSEFKGQLSETLTPDEIINTLNGMEV